jgi:hypothetical protein
MKKYWLLLLFFSLAVSSDVAAQFTRYIVKLKDKDGSVFSISNPSQFLSQRAIDRRLRYNIPITQSDLPVNDTYIQTILAAGSVRIINVSKWFNQVCIITNDPTAITRINALPFVLSAAGVAPRPANSNSRGDKLPRPMQNTVPATVAARPASPNDFYNYGLSYPQVHLHNAEFLHNHHFRGEGMQLAIMDAGFLNYLTLPTFDSIRSNNQVLNTWDFVAEKTSVNDAHPHGMNCLSTIAANMPGTFVGTAPKASFYLYRTEDANSEYPVEEQNFVAAAEKADSLGADAFSVSLGYNTFSNSIFNYSYADLNGHTSLIARAADMAAQKGIAVIVAAGNEGSNAWHYITTPADADSVLTIGAVDKNREVAGFSSFGPSSDGQIKPDIAAIGTAAVVANVSTGQPMYGNGTSFACPIMAGITTCLWQAFPEVNNRAIIDALRQSSDRANNPDNRTGYGIPDVKKAFVALQKKSFTQQIAIDNNCKTVLQWSVKTASEMNCVIERKLPSELDFTAIDTQQINSSFSKQNFTFSDDLNDLATGISIRYRIKMNIASDTSFYLDSATVSYTKSCKIWKENILISPNPVTDMLSVKITRSEPANIDLVVQNAVGQQIYQTSHPSIVGQQILTIPMQQLSSGIYFVTVLVDGKKAVVKKVVRA